MGSNKHLKKSFKDFFEFFGQNAPKNSLFWVKFPFFIVLYDSPKKKLTAELLILKIHSYLDDLEPF